MTSKQIELSFLYKLQESTSLSNHILILKLISKLERQIQDEQIIPLV
jgi:hypothetical protein